MRVQLLCRIAFGIDSLAVTWLQKTLYRITFHVLRGVTTPNPTDVYLEYVRHFVT